MLVVQSLPPSGNQILWKWGHQDPCHWVRLFTWVPIYMTFPTMSIRTIKCHFLFAMCTVNHRWPKDSSIFSANKLFCNCFATLILIGTHDVPHCTDTGTQRNTPQMLEFLCYWLFFEWPTWYQQSTLTNAIKEMLRQGRNICLVAQATCFYKGCKSNWVGNLTRGYCISWH